MSPNFRFLGFDLIMFFQLFPNSGVVHPRVVAPVLSAAVLGSPLPIFLRNGSPLPLAVLVFVSLVFPCVSQQGHVHIQNSLVCIFHSDIFHPAARIALNLSEPCYKISYSCYNPMWPY